MFLIHCGLERIKVNIEKKEFRLGKIFVPLFWFDIGKRNECYCFQTSSHFGVLNLLPVIHPSVEST